MPCDPYKTPCGDPRRPLTLPSSLRLKAVPLPHGGEGRCQATNNSRMRTIADRLSFLLAILVTLLFPVSAQAQWWSEQVAVPPYDPCQPIIVCPPQQVVVRRPIAQGEPTLTGPQLPAPSHSESQPIITHSFPAEETPSSSPPGSTPLGEITGHFRVVLTEALLNRLLARTDTNAGPVQDFILGANVSGGQTTESRVAVDVQPNTESAQLFLELTGTTVNQTIGVTPQAAVRSRGMHDFRLTKQVNFDGLKFTTRSPAAWVTPRLMNEGAVTPMSGMPLIGPLATRIVLSEAERRRPIAEQVVTQRVTEQVAPRFNREVDRRLGRANDRFRSSIPRLLSTVGLSPADQLFVSTEDQVLFGVGLPSTGAHTGAQVTRRRPARTTPVSSPTTGSNAGWIPIRQTTQRVSMQSRPFLPPPQGIGGRAMTVAIHELFVNHLLRHASLAGREVPDRTIDRLLNLAGNMLNGSLASESGSLRLGSDDPEFATILLAEEQPLSIRFENGQLIVVARAGFRPLVAPEVPTQRIEIPFALSTKDGQLTLVPGDVLVDDPAGEQSGAMVDVARPVIRQQVASRLQPVSLPNTIPLRLPELSPTSLTIRDIKLADGWLVIAVD